MGKECACEIIAVASAVQEQAPEFRYRMLSRSWRPLIPEGGMEGSCE